MERWLCTRRFVAGSRGKRRYATARIGPLRKSGRDWACDFHISNIGMKEPRRAYGVDRMQALILALEAVRVTLLTSPGGWRWVYAERGETGIPRFVPIAFGRKFAARLEAFIDAETEGLVTRAERRSSKKTARRRPAKRKSPRK